jgi:2-iminobutanoate/2-iminopropanoate deaminase
MKRKVVAPASVFKSKPFAFSQGVLVKEGKKTLFVSGQLAADRKGRLIKGNFSEQCRLSYQSIDEVLKEAGATKEDVVKITAYVTNMREFFDDFLKETKRYFTGEYPASTLVEVGALAFEGQLVEIEAIAIL